MIVFRTPVEGAAYVEPYTANICEAVHYLVFMLCAKLKHKWSTPHWCAAVCLAHGPHHYIVTKRTSVCVCKRAPPTCDNKASAEVIDTSLPKYALPSRTLDE